ncbi:MAG: type II secretion system protein [Planctomycetota bacterium]
MRSHRRSAFTLIELLVVMAIVIFLASFLIAALWPQKDKALRSKTAATLAAVSTALDQYYAEFHDFPPDGYDREPGWVKGNSYPNPAPKPGILLGGGPTGNKKFVYYGSGCLIYFLCYPISNVTIVGADQGAFDPRNLRVSPCNKGGAFLSSLKKEDVTTGLRFPDEFDWSIHPGHPSYGAGSGGTSGGQEWANGEIIDAYGYPIHYDKVADQSDATGAQLFFQKDRFTGNNKSFPFTDIHSDVQYMNSQVAGRVSPPDDTEANCCPDQAVNPGHSPGGSGGTGGAAVKHADPRGAAETDGCYIDNPSVAQAGNLHLPKPRNPGGYDLWAHGKCFANGITAITNWK